VDVARPAPGSLRWRIAEAHGVGANDPPWVSFFRRTDPLGYRVFSDHDSDIDRPTLEVPVAAAGDVGPRVAGHGDYPHAPEYRALVTGWLGEVPYETVHPLGSVADVPAQPR
jgi:hypothetical protein